MSGNYEMEDGSWDSEREEADRQQADFQADAREYTRLRRRILAAALRGDLAGAARLCRHGWSGRHEDGRLCEICGSTFKEGPDCFTPGPIVRLGVKPPRCPRCDEPVTLHLEAAEGACGNGHLWKAKVPA